MRQRLAAFMHSVARRLEGRPINDAARRADDARAIEREHLANISRPRSYADEVQALIDQRNAEIEAECAELRPTRYTRKLRSVR